MIALRDLHAAIWTEAAFIVRIIYLKIDRIWK